MKKYEEDEVLHALRRKHDVYVDSPFVQVLADKVWDSKSMAMVDNPLKNNDLGNKSWGRIDFLINHCGYRLQRVGKFVR